MPLACLENIIGLSEEECGCLDTAPEGFNTSVSGYYINDPEYGYPVLASALANANCIEGSVWDVLDKARARALLDIEQDLLATLRKERRAGLYSWSGTMGETKSNRAAGSISQQYAGLILRPKHRAIDISYVITALWAGFAHTGTVDVEIGSNTIGYAPVPVTLATSAGKFVRTELETPVSLPLYDSAQAGLAYTISYETAGITPRLNRAHCNCGGRPGWVNHFNVHGWRSDTAIADVDTSYIPKLCLQDWQGLAVEGYFACENLAFLCRLSELGGADMFSLLGRAAQYKAAIRLMMADRHSPKVNQFTLLNAEERAARITQYQEGYFNIMLFIAHWMPAGATSCWDCLKAAPKVALAVA